MVYRKQRYTPHAGDSGQIHHGGLFHASRIFSEGIERNLGRRRQASGPIGGPGRRENCAPVDVQPHEDHGACSRQGAHATACPAIRDVRGRNRGTHPSGYRPDEHTPPRSVRLCNGAQATSFRRTNLNCSLAAGWTCQCGTGARRLFFRTLTILPVCKGCSPKAQVMGPLNRHGVLRSLRANPAGRTGSRPLDALYGTRDRARLPWTAGAHTHSSVITWRLGPVSFLYGPNTQDGAFLIFVGDKGRRGQTDTDSRKDGPSRRGVPFPSATQLENHGAPEQGRDIHLPRACTRRPVSKCFFPLQPRRVRTESPDGAIFSETAR